MSFKERGLSASGLPNNVDVFSVSHCGAMKSKSISRQTTNYKYPQALPACSPRQHCLRKYKEKRGNSIRVRSFIKDDTKRGGPSNCD